MFCLILNFFYLGNLILLDFSAIIRRTQDNAVRSQGSLSAHKQNTVCIASQHKNVRL